MRGIILPDFMAEWDEENKKFFRLLDPLQWDLLIEKYSDPANKKSISELLTELLEG